MGAVVAADTLTLDIPAGQKISLIGANGAGKTTFVNMVTGYLKPDSGSISLDGLDIGGRSPRNRQLANGLRRAVEIVRSGLWPEEELVGNPDGLLVCRLFRFRAVIHRSQVQRLWPAQTVGFCSLKRGDKIGKVSVAAQFAHTIRRLSILLSSCTPLMWSRMRVIQRPCQSSP